MRLSDLKKGNVVKLRDSSYGIISPIWGTNGIGSDELFYTFLSDGSCDPEEPISREWNEDCKDNCGCTEYDIIKVWDNLEEMIKEEYM